jgi:hypothetical protein
MTTTKTKTLAAKARRLLRHRDRGKEQYAAADKLLRQMRDAGMKPGDTITINAGGDQVLLEDLYADTDKVFRAHGIGRFELSVVDRDGKKKKGIKACHASTTTLTIGADALRSLASALICCRRFSAAASQSETFRPTQPSSDFRSSSFFRLCGCSFKATPIRRSGQAMPS